MWTILIRCQSTRYLHFIYTLLGLFMKRHVTKWNAQVPTSKYAWTKHSLHSDKKENIFHSCTRTNTVRGRNENVFHHTSKF